VSAAGAAPLRGGFVGAGVGALVGLAGALALAIAPQHWLADGLTWLALDTAAAWVTRATLLGAGVGLLVCLVARAGAARGVTALLALAVTVGAAAWLLEACFGLSAYATLTSTVARVSHAATLLLALLLGHLVTRRAQSASVALLLPVLLVFGGAAALPALRPAAHGPHLLFISVDTLRADRLGCYGHAEARTPHIDALAAGGTLYETVIASAPVTLTATSTLMTGLDPTAHGAHYNGYYRLGPQATTLAEVLADRGWYTGAVIGNFALSGRFGTDQGFRDFDDRMTEVMQPDRKPRRNAREQTGTWWTRHLRNQPAQRFADEITSEALAWLEQRGEAPWFLWVHYMDPHSPYSPPADFASVHDPYDGEVAFVDREIGRLLDGHARLFPDTETVVVLVADHGENLGEHDYFGHVRSVDEVSLRVPLIVNDSRAPGGARETAPLRGRDVGGLVLEALGVTDGPPALRRAPPAGDAWWAYAQTYASRFLDGKPPTRVLREARYKFVDLPGDTDRLFDLGSDPTEDHDLSGEQAERLAGMRERLTRFTGDVSDAPEIVDDATREVLEQLGYVGDH
jgi:arylsulfatase A-like enzyme